MEGTDSKRPIMTKESELEQQAGNKQSHSTRYSSGGAKAMQYKPMFMPEPARIAKLPDRASKPARANKSYSRASVVTSGLEQPPYKTPQLPPPSPGTSMVAKDSRASCPGCGRELNGKMLELHQRTCKQRSGAFKSVG